MENRQTVSPGLGETLAGEDTSCGCSLQGDNCLSAVSLAWVRPGFLKQGGHDKGSGTEMVCVQKLHFKEEKKVP